MQINFSAEDQKRTALLFWRDAYRLGVRIIFQEGQFKFLRSMNYNQRLDAFGGFGLFPADQVVEPSERLLRGVETHAECLRYWLFQKPPTQYAKFFYHLLTCDHELEPIEHHAAENGFDIRGVGMDGGYFLFYHGKREPVDGGRLRSVPPITSHIKEISLAN